MPRLLGRKGVCRTSYSRQYGWVQAFGREGVRRAGSERIGTFVTAVRAEKIWAFAGCSGRSAFALDCDFAVQFIQHVAAAVGPEVQPFAFDRLVGDVRDVLVQLVFPRERILLLPKSGS